MSHTPATATLPSTLRDNSFLLSVTPSRSTPPSIAQYSAGLAHDARNMLAAMDIYCELLGTPGVLQPEHRHFLNELRLLRESSGQLLDRLLVEALRCLSSTGKTPAKTRSTVSAALIPHPRSRHAASTPSAVPVSQPVPSGDSDAHAVRNDKLVVNLSVELQTILPVLTALAGPKVELNLNAEACPRDGLYMSSVDFKRTLINLVRNATEAMAAGGRIAVTASPVMQRGVSCVLLSIEDNGPGIPLSLLDRIFENPLPAASDRESVPKMSFRPRGLGLRIVREFVESGRGTIRAVRLQERGSRFEIVLPVVTNIFSAE